MQTTRRKILGSMAAVAAVGVGATQVLGANGEEISISIDEINADEEYIVLRNNGDSDINISGFTLAFEYSNEDYNQRRKLPEGTVVSADGTLKVATGAKEVSDAVVVERPYDGEVLNNEREDVIALLDTDGNVVATSEETPQTTTQETTTEATTTPEETTTEDGGDETTTETTTEDESSNETTTTTDDGGEANEEESSEGTETDDTNSGSKNGGNEGSEETAAEEDC